MEPSAQPLSRRRFAQLLGLGVATTALRPSVALAKKAGRVAAGRSGVSATPSRTVSDISDVVRLSSNENPYGPSPAAFEAMRNAFGLAWRYPDEAIDALAADIAAHHQVGADHILLGDGSTEVLLLCAAAFTGPGRPVVVAEPTFEALARHARTGGAEVKSVPLTPEYGHDLPKMLAAAGGSGLIYVCNPNNPTATITPKEAMRTFLSGLPNGVTALVDEAYFHYAEDPGYETVIPLVQEHKNLIVARTFSKVYGMAGLRCGYAVARPEALELLRAHQAWDTVNAMAVAAARASLADPPHVAQSRRLNAEAKAFVTGALEGMGYKLLPSATNFLMVDLRRPVGPVIEALKQRKVEVGRVFPALPTHLRVTVGTKPQMKAFLDALQQVLA
jgi:histidinol-phosphate aminotransferase